MKKFYSWYKKHITAAIFTGLILGIITGLLSWVSLASVMPAQPARSQPVP